MASSNDFYLKPLPIEKEFCILSIKQKLQYLSREELEEFLVESLSIMAKLANQATQLRERIDQLEGKT